MHIIKFIPYTVVVSLLLFIHQGAIAHDHPTQSIQHGIEHTEMNNSQQMGIKNSINDDHTKAHGAQVYTVTTVDQTWLMQKNAHGRFISEIESKIGTDENKIFMKSYINKPESSATEYDLTLLYSHMISDYWDAQIGVQYQVEKLQQPQYSSTEKKLHAVMGIHGMAPYFFETDAHLYFGEDNSLGLSIKTERDLLLTQKVIFKPYFDVDIIIKDASKYAKPSSLNSLTTGIETRYEVSKKIMPYIHIAHEYSKANTNTFFKSATRSEKNWLYGVGIRFRF